MSCTDDEDFVEEAPRMLNAFPGAAGWEITRENSLQWLWNLRWRRQSGAPLWSGDHGDREERLLLIYDLLYYEELCSRFLMAMESGAAGGAHAATPPPPIEEYLRPGREEWGYYARLGRHWSRRQGEPD